MGPTWASRMQCDGPAVPGTDRDVSPRAYARSVNILNFGPTAEPETMLGWARFAEGSGYDFAMISDHVVITPDVAEQYLSRSTTR